MRKQRPTYLELAVLREAAAVGATMRSSLIKAGIVTVKGSSATLNRLESKGWIRSDVDLGPPLHGGWKRRVYTITKLGQQMLEKRRVYTITKLGQQMLDGENTLTPKRVRELERELKVKLLLKKDDPDFALILTGIKMMASRVSEELKKPKRQKR